MVNLNPVKVAQARKVFYDVKSSHLVLPGLLLGNMAYKLGSEKDPVKQKEVFINSILSWIGGSILVNANSNIIPYYTLPAIAFSTALYKIGQKDTTEERADTAINHAVWWTSGIFTERLASALKLSNPFQKVCAFAVGSSVIGPIIAALLKQKLLPKIVKDPSSIIKTTTDTINPKYQTGNASATYFSPFNDYPNGTKPAAASLNSGYDFTDRYKLKKINPKLLEL
jgi:hypothetical protein